MELIDGKTVMNSFVNTIKREEERIIRSSVYKTKLYGISDIIQKSTYDNDYAIILLSNGRLCVVCMNLTSTGTYKTTKYTYYYDEIDNNPFMLNVTKLDDNDKDKSDGIKYKTPFTVIIYSKNIHSKYFNVKVNEKKSYEVDLIINSTFQRKAISSYTFIKDTSTENKIEGFTSGFYYNIDYYSRYYYYLYNITEFADYDGYTLVNRSNQGELYCFAATFDNYNIYCDNNANSIYKNWLKVLVGGTSYSIYTKLCILLLLYNIILYHLIAYSNITQKIDEVLENQKEELIRSVDIYTDPCYGNNRRILQPNVNNDDVYDPTGPDDDISGFYEEHDYSGYYTGYFFTPTKFIVNYEDKYCYKLSSSSSYSNCFVQYVYNIKINTTTSINISKIYYN